MCGLFIALKPFGFVAVTVLLCAHGGCVWAICCARHCLGEWPCCEAHGSESCSGQNPEQSENQQMLLACIYLDTCASLLGVLFMPVVPSCWWSWISWLRCCQRECGAGGSCREAFGFTPITPNDETSCWFVLCLGVATEAWGLQQHVWIHLDVRCGVPHACGKGCNAYGHVVLPRYAFQVSCQSDVEAGVCVFEDCQVAWLESPSHATFGRMPCLPTVLLPAAEERTLPERQADSVDLWNFWHGSARSLSCIFAYVVSA